MTGKFGGIMLFICILFSFVCRAADSGGQGKQGPADRVPAGWRIPVYDAPLAGIRKLLDRDAASTILQMGDQHMGYRYDGKNLTFYYRKKKDVYAVWLTGSFNEWNMKDGRWNLLPGSADDPFFTLVLPVDSFKDEPVLFKFLVWYGKNRENPRWEIYSFRSGAGQWD